MEGTLIDGLAWAAVGGALIVGAIGGFILRGPKTSTAQPSAPRKDPDIEEKLRAALSESETLRGELTRTEAALREARAAPAAPVAAPQPSSGENKLRAAFDDADALRVRLAQAEAALRDARAAAMKAAKTPAAPASAPPAKPTSSEKVRALTDDINVLHRRLAQAESALRAARRGGGGETEIAALKAQLAALAPQTAKGAKERLQALAGDLETLRSRATMAETALRRLRIASA